MYISNMHVISIIPSSTQVHDHLTYWKLVYSILIGLDTCLLLGSKKLVLSQAIDNKKETIRVTNSRNLGVSELSDQMPESAPRFNLFRYSHLKDGKSQEFVPGQQLQKPDNYAIGIRICY